MQTFGLSLSVRIGIEFVQTCASDAPKQPVCAQRYHGVPPNEPIALVIGVARLWLRGQSNARPLSARYASVTLMPGCTAPSSTQYTTACVQSRSCST